MKYQRIAEREGLNYSGLQIEVTRCAIGQPDKYALMLTDNNLGPLNPNVELMSVVYLSAKELYNLSKQLLSSLHEEIR